MLFRCQGKKVHYLTCFQQAELILHATEVPKPVFSLITKVDHIYIPQSLTLRWLYLKITDIAKI